MWDAMRPLVMSAYPINVIAIIIRNNRQPKKMWGWGWR